MKKLSKLTRICNIISAVLLAVLMVTQFLPYWYSVDGVHMTAEEYATYIPPEPTVDNKMTAATEPVTEPATTAATEGTGATEATTAATEATTAATEATTAATEGTGATDATAAATEGTAAATEAPTEAPKATVAPTEPAEPVIKTVSIARAAWFPEKEKGAPVLLFHALIMLLGVAGIFFCTTKGYGKLNFVWPLATAAIAIRGYLVNPGAQTGMMWYLHLIPAALMIIPGLIVLIKWLIGVIRALTIKE